MTVPAVAAASFSTAFSTAPPPPPRTILASASGALAPGELVAILGASGCGKTTLLSILAGRQRPTEGAVRLTGATAAGGAAALQFIAQEDLFMPHLTVREHLCFQARLRLPRLPRARAEARADALLAQLGLAPCSGSLIGSGAEGVHGRGISGGERKRLSIATALVSAPALILADEPTSGLDSANAARVVGTLRDLARSGCAIACSIHGPSSQVFSHFDRVILLGEGGVTVFAGSAQAALAHFAALGAPLPPLTNPADFFIHALTALPGSDAQAQAHNALQRALLEVAAAAAAGPAAGGAHPPPPLPPLAQQQQQEPAPAAGPAPPPWLHQFALLFHRNSLSMARDPVLLYTRWAQTLVLSLLAGSVYWRLGGGQTGVQDVNGAAFFLLINQSLASIVGVLQTFPVERAVIAREHDAGVHCTSAYFLAKSLSALPWELAFPTVFTTICFYMMQLRPDASSTTAWLQLTGVVVLVSQVAVAMGLWVSTVAPTVAVALAIAPVVLLPFILFSGFLLNVSTIAPAFAPLEYTSLFRYGFSASMRILWQGRQIQCDRGPLLCPFPSGEAVLAYFSLDKDSLATDLLCLGGLALGWRLLALLTLMARAQRR